MKWVISQAFFPANVLASSEETKPNATKANNHPEHKKNYQVWSPRMTSSLEKEEALFYCNYYYHCHYYCLYYYHYYYYYY